MSAATAGLRGVPLRDAMLRCLESWIDQTSMAKPEAFREAGLAVLLDHLGSILNTAGRGSTMGVVEAINGNLKTLLRRGRGYKNLRSLLLKAQRMAVLRTEFVMVKKVA